MKTVHFPYGKSHLSYDFDEDQLIGVLTSSIENTQPRAGGQELVEQALALHVVFRLLPFKKKGRRMK